MAKDPPPWEKLELLVADLQRQFHPQAVVRHNHWIRGGSGSPRKLDVSLTITSGPTDVLIAFDCKKHKGRVKRSDVVLFADQVDDVGAGLGIMISDSGFEASAKSYATGKNGRIVLQTYRRAMETDWKSTLEGGIFSYIDTVEPSDIYANLVEECGQGYLSVPLDTALFFEDGSYAGSLSDLFLATWKISASNQVIGPATLDLTDIEPPAFIGHSDGTLHLIQAVRMSFVNLGKRYVVNYRLAEGHIIQSVVGKQRSYKQLITAGVDWEQLLETQTPILLSQEEYDQGQRDAVLSVDMTGVKRFIRAVLSQIDDDVSD